MSMSNFLENFIILKAYFEESGKNKENNGNLTWIKCKQWWNQCVQIPLTQ